VEQEKVSDCAIALCDIVVLTLFCHLIVDVTSVLAASFYIHFGDYRGNAVAVTSTKALTALHGKSIRGDDVELIDCQGKKRNARVIFSAFVALQVDIAVVELCNDETPFAVFIPICDKPVRLLQSIIVVGVKSGLSDTGSSVYASHGEVTFIEPSGTLFQSTYACHDGLSGAGVIVAIEGGMFHVVGVHVASHDYTESPPPIKKVKGCATAESVSNSSRSLASSIHGHLICEVRRVHDIAAQLAEC
jgi:hypothetical protein